MRLVGTFTVAAPVVQVWQIFQDTDALCGLAPSCEGARRLDECHYEGTIRMRAALLTARAHVLGTVLHTEPPHSMRVAISGRTTGVPGSFEGVAQLWLREIGTATQGEYVFDLDVLGRVGALGQPLFQTASQRLVASFADKVSRHLDTIAL